MKKKVLSVLLALAMMLVLSACNGGATTGGESAERGGENAESGDAQKAAESDLNYVQDKGTLIIGITEFEPMDYQDAAGNWIGFDADMAAAFAQSLGVEPVFQIIDWDNKVFELEGKSIDVVWNGMTLTDEVLNSMECSKPYFNNAQVVIVPVAQADTYQELDSLEGLHFAVESGSAGEAQAQANGFTYTQVADQATALLEVSSGTADAAIIDFLMAKAMTGEGTNYADLTYTLSLNSEEYGVGFRKGSDLADALNDFFAQSYQDGSMVIFAQTYGIEQQLVAQ